MAWSSSWMILYFQLGEGKKFTAKSKSRPSSLWTISYQTFSFHLVLLCLQTMDSQAVRFTRVLSSLLLCPCCLHAFQPVTLLWVSIRFWNKYSTALKIFQTISLVQPSRVSDEEIKPQKGKRIWLRVHILLEAATLSILILVICYPMPSITLATDTSKYQSGLLV